ncbi:MAG: tRNA-dihydrouridine synthase [Halanaeroarchaeum sp.]
MFEPRLALASLSGESDAEWAARGARYAGAAFLGGLALDESTREAARSMVTDRDRTEFLPPDPFDFLESQLGALDAEPIRAGCNVRATDPGPIRRAAATCAAHDAIVEINAHCRQAEMCAVGAGESLLRAPERLAAQVSAASASGAAVSIKVRAEVDGVDLPAIAHRLASAGADAIHVDAMDTESVVASVVDAADLFVIANNGVRDAETARAYLAHGADAVSVGRPSDDPAVLDPVAATVEEWFE